MVTNVLLCGWDLGLLQARESVLCRAGFSVAITSGPSGIEAALRHLSLRLVILCHSLPRHDQAELIRKIQTQRPTVEILILGGMLETVTYEGCHHLNVFDGPISLIGAVAELLGDEQAQA